MGQDCIFDKIVDVAVADGDCCFMPDLGRVATVRHRPRGKIYIFRQVHSHCGIVVTAAALWRA